MQVIATPADMMQRGAHGFQRFDVVRKGPECFASRQSRSGPVYTSTLSHLDIKTIRILTPAQTCLCISLGSAAPSESELTSVLKNIPRGETVCVCVIHMCYQENYLEK